MLIAAPRNCSLDSPHLSDSQLAAIESICLCGYDRSPNYNMIVSYTDAPNHEGTLFNSCSLKFQLPPNL